MEEDKSGRQSPVVSPLLQYPPVYHGQRLCGQFGCGAPGYHNGYNPWAYGHPAAAPWSRYENTFKIKLLLHKLEYDEK